MINSPGSGATSGTICANELVSVSLASGGTLRTNAPQSEPSSAYTTRVSAMGQPLPRAKASRCGVCWTAASDVTAAEMRRIGGDPGRNPPLSPQAPRPARGTLCKALPRVDVVFVGHRRAPDVGRSTNARSVSPRRPPSARDGARCPADATSPVPPCARGCAAPLPTKAGVRDQSARGCR